MVYRKDDMGLSKQLASGSAVRIWSREETDYLVISLPIHHNGEKICPHWRPGQAKAPVKHSYLWEDYGNLDQGQLYQEHILQPPYPTGSPYPNYLLLKHKSMSSSLCSPINSTPLLPCPSTSLITLTRNPGSPPQWQRFIPFAASAQKERQENSALLNQDTSTMDITKNSPPEQTKLNNKLDNDLQVKKKQLMNEIPLTSTYQKDFVKGQIPQQLVLQNQHVQQTKRELKHVPPTTYQQSFCDLFKNPQQFGKKEVESEATDKKEDIPISSEALVDIPIKCEARRKQVTERYSVAQCLIWPASLK
ncbi:uncharacterized protein LOC119949889 [Tachyglossus aculeatus]|uniref:uncharacterized protein LOC119949889 n=1 Tax=Tachyglossus aculeatus TaxID=9261 RepID=UPI0018F2F09B|nr:uncharacterized protein LOC119949889 [Tachyglossus aculeatus]